MRAFRARPLVLPILVTLVAAAALAVDEHGSRSGSQAPTRPAVADPVEWRSPELERLAVPQPSGEADAPATPLPVAPAR